MYSLSRSATIHEFIPDSQADQKDPATFVYREPRRREYRQLMQLLQDSADSSGNVQFNIESAYELASICMQGVKNVEVDGEPLDLSRDEDGRVVSGDLDLFEPRDIFALAMEIMASAQLTGDQAEK